MSVVNSAVRYCAQIFVFQIEVVVRLETHCSIGNSLFNQQLAIYPLYEFIWSLVTVEMIKLCFLISV